MSVLKVATQKHKPLTQAHPSDLFNFQGIRLLSLGQTQKAKKLFDKAILNCHKQDFLRHSACLNNLACYYKQVGDISASLVLIRRSTFLVQKLCNSSPNISYQYALADAYINQGVLQSINGHHRNSLKLCKKGMKILQKYKKDLGQHQNVLTISLYNQAVQLLYLKQNKKAQKIFQKVQSRCSKNDFLKLPQFSGSFTRRKTITRAQVKSDHRSKKNPIASTIDSWRDNSKKSVCKDTLMPLQSISNIMLN